jgi:hypothetical protein
MTPISLPGGCGSPTCAAYATAEIGFDHIPVPDGDPEFLADRLPRIVEVVPPLGRRRRSHSALQRRHEPRPHRGDRVHARARGMALSAALELVKARRSCIAPYVRALERCYGAIG